MSGDKDDGASSRRPARPRKSRRKSRELVLKGLYQWRLTGYPLATIEQQLQEDELFAEVDLSHFSALLHGVVGQAAELDMQLAPHLDRKAEGLSPIEHSILRLAAFELVQQPETPYRVVINEAVELAKQYGGTDGYKYVNGVLDKLAAEVRAAEVKAKRQPVRE
jgi:N utilization substance protein B